MTSRTRAVGGGGRPAMGSAPAAVESVRLDPEMKRALTLRAAADGMSVSETIRRAVGTYLAGKCGRAPWRPNSFASRGDAQRAVRDLFAPLVPAYRDGGAHVRLGSSGAAYDVAGIGLEAFARPLWGLAPLAAGGGDFPYWDLLRTGLVEGTDPRHPRYWGRLERTDQRMVEMAAIGFALALVPGEVFNPLARAEQQRVLAWLQPINSTPLHPNNWQFFRVIVNLGFAEVGGPYDADAVASSLDAIESHWLGDGWYADGLRSGRVDLYIAWAYHLYGLVYARLAREHDPVRAARFRARATRFASDFAAWFDSSGRVIPYGRSLTYRFAACAFWGALAFAGEEALPWGQVRGLWGCHLRWWGEQPLARGDGVLSVGYGYETLLASETYNAPGSPYWAMKAFLPLALTDDHPFWTSTEEPTRVAPSSVQRPAVMVVNRDESQSQLLVGGRGKWQLRQGAAKYGRFAYSSAFGFAVDPDDPAHLDTADSALVLRDADAVRRVRAAVTDSGIDGDVLWSVWWPYPDVEVVTVLCGSAPWHVRLHQVRTGRWLSAIECGFAVGYDGSAEGVTTSAADGTALVRTPAGVSALTARFQHGEPEVADLQPNTYVLTPRALVPTLRRTLEVGEHTLGCVAAATEGPLDTGELPDIPERAWQTLARHTPRAGSTGLT